MDNNTVIVEYCLFPHILRNKTLGDVKDWMKKRKAKKSDIAKFEMLLSSNPKNFVSVSISGKDNIQLCPYNYRVKPLSWWERNFTFADHSL